MELCFFWAGSSGLYATCLGQFCVRVLPKVFGLEPALSVVAAAGVPKILGISLFLRGEVWCGSVLVAFSAIYAA